MAKLTKTWKVLTIIIAGLILILGGFLTWLSFGKLTPAKLAVFKIVPYPLALINGRPVPMKTYLQNLDWAEIYNQKQSAPQDSSNLQKAVLNQVLREEKTKQLAAGLKVTVSQQQLAQEYSNFQNDFDQQSSQPLAQALPEYGFTPAQFQTEILEPQILLEDLAIWHNAQRSLNQDSYQTMGQIQQKLAAGESFESLAQEYTQDPGGKQVQGDLGFVESSNLLPELRTGIESMQAGEVKILPSRFGLNLIKLEEKASSPQNGSQRLHLKQIFIEPSNFQTWYEAQLNNYKTTMLVKI